MSDQNIRFIYKNQKPFIIKLFGGLVILFALLKIQDTPVFSIVIGLCSSMIFVYQKGVEVDLSQRRYKYFTSFGPQELGAWIDAHNVEYVSVFSASYVSTATGMGAHTASVSERLYEVNLITDKKQRINIGLTSDINEAFDTARRVAASWSLRIYDASTREAKWIEG